MTTYDCTEDVKRHQGKVAYWMRDFAHVIEERSKTHDNSKLEFPEKDVFDRFTMKLKETDVESEEYKQQLAAMGAGLEHHYKNNRHHPEHYQNGIDGMTLHDIVEMLCDWMAVSEDKGVPISLDYFKNRFSLSDQLVSILRNTLKEQDEWNTIGGVPVIDFIQE